MASSKNIAGITAQNSTVATVGTGQLVQNGARKDLRLNMMSSDAEAGQDTSAAATAGDTVPLSPGNSSETNLESQPLSPADTGRNVAVDYMKTRYEGDKSVKDQIIMFPKVIREPQKLDFQWDKVVDEKLKRSDPTVPVIKEQDLVALMLTCAGLDSGKSQYLSLVESKSAASDPIPVNREPVEKVAPPEITKKVRNMFETGNLTDLHESTKKLQETYEVLPGSGVFENEPVRIDGVVRESDLNEEGHGVQRGATKSLLDHWKTKMTEEDVKVSRNRPVFVTEAEGKVFESTPIRRSDVVREDDLEWNAAHIEKGLTKSLMNQWSNIGSTEFKSPKTRINVAEAEGKVLENNPVRRNDVIREDDVNAEGELVQKGITRNLLSQWSGKETEESRIERKPIRIAEGEGRVAENEPIRRNDVVREEDVNLEGEQVEKGLTKTLLSQWKNKDKEEYSVRKRVINLAEDEGSVVENQPIRRDDVVHANDTEDTDTVQKGTTKSLLAQWKTKGTEDYKPGMKRPIHLAEAEGKMLENEPIRRSDVIREGDVVLEGEQVQKGTTRSLLNQWQNKREEFKKDKTPIIVTEAEGVVAENEPTRRDDVVRENDLEAEGERIQRGTTRALLSQWQNNKDEFQKEKTPIIVAEAEGTISENDPIKRTDVVREEDIHTDGEVVQRGTTKTLLNQWKHKGSQEFVIERKPIDISEGEGIVAENEPVQRSDVVNTSDSYLESEQVQKDMIKNLREQWKKKGSEEFKIAKRNIVIAEDEGRVAENEPQRRDDVIRENELDAEVQVQKGYTKSLLSQWKNKGSQEFKLPKRDIVIMEGDGMVAENQPSPRHDVIRENDSSTETEQIQKGLTRNLLGQWKNKGSEEFRAAKREIILAEDEGTVVENNPVQRSDIVREGDFNSEGEQIQKGCTKTLLGKWKNKGNEEYKAPKREIIWAEDEGKIAENDPVQRSDVFREDDANLEGEKIQKGYTKSLLGQWKNKGNEEFKAAKREIVLAEDEGKVVENDPVQRSDVIREDDANLEGEKIQKGYTKSLLGQWKNKGNEEFKGPKREIIWAEDEGKIAENDPVQRSDVIREDDANLEGEKIQKGYTKSLLGQWKNKGNEEFKAAKREIVLAEDEGKVVENDPVQRSDVFREDDANLEGEKIQKGYTKNLLGQWKNKGNEEFKGPKREIIWAEDEGKIVENEPLRRDDVVREYDLSLEGERIQRGMTRNLLGQWKSKGTQQFTAARKEIVLAEDEGRIVENEPVQRTDVFRETDIDPKRELPKKGQAHNLKVQWMSSREEAPKERSPVNVIENDSEPSVVENNPIQRNDVVREGDNFEEVFLKRGFAKDLAGYWQYRQEEELPKEPFRLEMDISKDEVAVHENEPIELKGVVKWTDPVDDVMGKRGLIQMVAKKYLESDEKPSPKSREQINMDLADGPTILENQPVPVGPDVVRSDYTLIDDTSVTAGLTKNLLERWKYQSLDSSSPRTPSSLVDGKPAWVVEMEEASGSGVFENQPDVRTDVIREVDYEPEMIPIKQTRNTRKMWSRMEQEEGDISADREIVPQLVRFTPPRELTPPPVHQEDFKSYQSITLSSGPNTPGPMSPQTLSQPGWAPSGVRPRHPPPQNHSGLSTSASSQKTSVAGLPLSKRGTGAAYRMQPPSTLGSSAAYRKQPPDMGSSYSKAQPETTLKSSAVLVLKPS